MYNIAFLFWWTLLHKWPWTHDLDTNCYTINSVGRKFILQWKVWDFICTIKKNTLQKQMYTTQQRQISDNEDILFKPLCIHEINIESENLSFNIFTSSLLLNLTCTVTITIKNGKMNLLLGLNLLYPWRWRKLFTIKT